MGYQGAGNLEIDGIRHGRAAGVLRGDGLCAGHDVDFANLDDVSSTRDSHIRVALLTQAQLHFETSLGGVDFRPKILSATHCIAVATTDNYKCRRAASHFGDERAAA